ncbi:transcriptional regulator [Streptomyces resistomycificus]|uniref:Transcriptional regulator n=1 Tax=Streptomyces resistomycificus TaxID=67356 RepID=A0A0L8LKI9_9ACTN|nr:transcriptional regulator [Streptomyces resistomycificus]KUO00544.1 transcriptional regulator [Streptomyces resistomycificus]
MLRAVYGDPRAAAELLPRLTERQAAGLDPLPTEPAELAPALLRAHRAEIQSLPDDTRLLLLLAAADQHPVPTHAFPRAVTAARLDTRPLEAAEAAGIAQATADGVLFRDAWTRIAAYETGSPAARRDVHRLLAGVLRGDGETAGRSWHRGAGALGPSGRLATELGAAAERACAAGRRTTARALAERAAALSPDPHAQSRLLALAAACAWQSGDADRARRLAAAAQEETLTGVLALRAGNASEAFDALLGAAVRRAAGESGGEDAEAGGEPSAAGPVRSVPAQLLAHATEAVIHTGDLRRCREAAQTAERVGIAAPGTLAGLAAAFDGRYEDARDLLMAAAGRCGPGGDPTVLMHAGIAALLLGDHTRAATATLRAADSARTRGETATVVQAMEFRAYAEFWTGRSRVGEAAARDALGQAYATGQDNGACHLRAALAMFAAVTGDTDACREHAAAARSYALARGLGLPAALAQWALAHLDLSSGRYAAAAARLRALAAFGPGHGHRAIRHLATPHYVEAAVRTGDTRVARAAHADYHRWATTVLSPDDLALSARCRALLATGGEAVDHYRDALDLHSRGTRDFERARTELLFGSALRRLRRRTEARDRLHSALEAFDAFGAPHLAAQARTELRALGAPASSAQAAPDTPTARLTAQQLLIARMAADGATNREIAVRLALSPRTIDHHLRGVFTRLGIRSRIDLVRLLAEGDET